MSRYGWVVGALVVVLAAEARADETRLGGSLVLNFHDCLGSNVEDCVEDSRDPLTSVGLGARVERTFGEQLALRLESTYLRKGANFDYRRLSRLRFSVLELAFQGKASLWPGRTQAYFLAGPTLGLRLTSPEGRVRTLGYSPIEYQEESQRWKGLQPGFRLGGGVQTRRKALVSLEVQYAWSRVYDGPTTIRSYDYATNDFVTTPGDRLLGRSEGVQIRLSVAKP